MSAFEEQLQELTGRMKQLLERTDLTDAQRQSLTRTVSYLDRLSANTTSETEEDALDAAYTFAEALLHYSDAETAVDQLMTHTHTSPELPPLPPNASKADTIRWLRGRGKGVWPTDVEAYIKSLRRDRPV